MTLSTAPVVGIPDRDFWPQIYTRRGDHWLFTCAYCVHDGGDVRRIGREILKKLDALPHESLIELSKALQALYQDYAQYIASCSAGYIEHDRIILWTAKQGAVHLKRQAKCGVVVHSDEWKIVEGKLHEHDVFFFGTAASFTVLPHPLSASFGTPEELAESCIPLVHTHKESPKIAACIVQYAAEPEERSEEILHEIPEVEKQQGDGQKDDRYADRSFVHENKRVGGIKLSKRAFGMLVGLICLVGIGGIVMVGARSARARELRIQHLLEPFTTQLEQAKRQETTNINDARLSASAAVQNAQTQLVQIEKKSYEYVRLQAFLKEAQEYYDRISGEKQLSSLPVFFNFQLVKAGFVAHRLTVQDRTVVFLDTEKRDAIALQIDKKQSSLVDLPGTEEAHLLDIAFLEKHPTILTDAGVIEQGEKIISSSDEWKEPRFLRVFGSSLYVWDNGVQQLFKYSKKDGSNNQYSSASKWIKPARGVDPSTFLSFAIDGKLWVGTSTGEVFVYAQGVRQPFTVQGLLVPFSSPVTVYTAEQLDSVYILEPAKARLVELGKDGVYKRSFLAKELGAVSSFVVDDEGTMALCAAGSVVYMIDLR